MTNLEKYRLIHDYQVNISAKALKFRNFKVYNNHIITVLRSSKVHYKRSDLYSILSMHFSEKTPYYPSFTKQCKGCL